jgi:hypothetical protein
VYLTGPKDTKGQEAVWQGDSVTFIGFLAYLTETVLPKLSSDEDKEAITKG